MEENDREFKVERSRLEAESAEVDRLEREFVGRRVRHTVTGDSGIATAVGFKRGCPEPVVVVRWDSEDDPSACAPALLTRTASRAEVFSAARDRWHPEVLRRERSDQVSTACNYDLAGAHVGSESTYGNNGRRRT